MSRRSGILTSGGVKISLVFAVMVLLVDTGVVLDGSGGVKADGGNIIYVSDDYPTIWAVIDNASGGDTIFVYSISSPYQENIFINESIPLIDGGKTQRVIKGTLKLDVMNSMRELYGTGW